MENEVAAGLSVVWAGHFEAQERRVATQEQAVVALLAGSLDAAAREAAARDAHKLAGSLGTFGLDEGSSLAGQIEEAWLAEHQEMASLATTVAALRKLLEEHRPALDASAVKDSRVAADGIDILLVDDDDVFARYVLEPLRRRYRVSWVTNGESALSAVAGSAKQGPPRLVLLDIEMPGMNGLTVLEQLAEQRVPERCAVVMLTRRTLAEDIVRARKLGAFDFLAKPISVSRLNERVGRALETVHQARKPLNV
jgi:CheY-like chemotaxis protein/HPt (histidine-containing phosphotransfer) domain-containing protein